MLLVALLAQLGGAWLKGPHLGQRLAHSVERDSPDLLDRAMQALLFLHFILFALVTLMGLILAGIAPIDFGDAWVALSLAVAALTTIIVWQAGMPPKEAQLQDSIGGEEAGFNAGSEYLGDALLWISVSIITSTFWGMLIGDVGTAVGIGLNLRALVLLLASSFLFVVFYLPARYLFLVEDYRSPLTWLQMWLVMAPLTRLVLVG